MLPFQGATTGGDILPKAMPLGWDMTGFQPYQTQFGCIGAGIRPDHSIFHCTVAD
jgi:hypothetical protein